MKTKIAYIIPTLSLGGAEKQQVNILNGLDIDKYDIQLYILKSNTKLVSQVKSKNIGINVYSIDNAFNIYKWYQFIKDIKKFHPDIIHSHMFNANIISRLLKILFPYVKIVNHVHGMSEWISTFKLMVDRYTQRFVDKIIVVSHKSYRLRQEREKYPEHKLFLLYNSVDVLDMKTYLHHHQKKNNKVIIGMASRMIKLKRIDAGLYMFKALQDLGLDIQMKIAGDGPEKENLIQYAKDSDIIDSVDFLGFTNDMNNFFRSIDIFCISSEIEDMPLSIAEALIMGKPVIASNIGGIPEILENLEGTILVNDFWNKEEIQEIYNFIKNLNFDYLPKVLQTYAIKHFDNHAYCMELGLLYDKLKGK